MSQPYSIADIWFVGLIPCGVLKAPLAWPTRTPITTPIPAPQVHSFNDMTWGDLEDWILSQERSRDSRGSVFTGPIFQESDPMYEGVKVPVQFYKVVVVIDDAKGQLSVTAFQMDLV
jgi:hypothetical protein